MNETLTLKIKNLVVLGILALAVMAPSVAHAQVTDATEMIRRMNGRYPGYSVNGGPYTVSKQAFEHYFRGSFGVSGSASSNPVVYAAQVDCTARGGQGGFDAYLSKRDVQQWYMQKFSFLKLK